jgi:hypothetical protein
MHSGLNVFGSGHSSSHTNIVDCRILAAPSAFDILGYRPSENPRLARLQRFA